MASSCELLRRIRSDNERVSLSQYEADLTAESAMARTKTAEQSAVSAAIPVIKTPDDSVHMIQSDLDAIKVSWEL